MSDPRGEYLDPPLQGYRLAGDKYQRMEPDAEGALDTRELELRLRIADGHLDFVRWGTGERLLTRNKQLLREAGARRSEEAARPRSRTRRSRGRGSAGDRGRSRPAPRRIGDPPAGGGVSDLAEIT